jgi:hypothetical protein
MVGAESTLTTLVATLITVETTHQQNYSNQRPMPKLDALIELLNEIQADGNPTQVQCNFDGKFWHWKLYQPNISADQYRLGKMPPPDRKHLDSQKKSV